MTEERIIIEEEMIHKAETSKTAWLDTGIAKLRALFAWIPRLGRKLRHKTTTHHMVLYRKDGKVFLDIPILSGIIGMICLGPWAIMGIIAAWLSEMKMAIEPVSTT